MDLESDVQQVALMERPGDANGMVALRVNLVNCIVYFCYCFFFFCNIPSFGCWDKQISPFVGLKITDSELFFFVFSLNM